MGRVALVTGSGKRVGRAIAKRLGDLGYDLALHYHSSDVGVRELKEELRCARAELFQKDLRKSFAPKELIEEVGASFGRLDLLINNASTYPAGERIVAEHRLENESEAEFDEAINVNLKAPFFLMKYAYPLMRSGERGLIVNILDLSVESPMLSRAAHTVSKGGLVHATKLAAASFPEIRVVGLLLGHILPGEQMTEADRSRINWIGVKPVVDQLEQLVTGDAVSGEIYRVT